MPNGESFIPAAVIGKAYNNTRQDKEEVHSQIAMRHRSPVKALKHMIHNNKQGRDTAQPV